jgi:hypothetical protein
MEDLARKLFRKSSVAEEIPSEFFFDGAARPRASAKTLRDEPVERGILSFVVGTLGAHRPCRVPHLRLFPA